MVFKLEVWILQDGVIGGIKQGFSAETALQKEKSPACQRESDNLQFLAAGRKKGGGLVRRDSGRVLALGRWLVGAPYPVNGIGRC